MTLTNEKPLILLVEPHDAAALPLTELLEGQGFTVVRALTGEAALAGFELSHPDLIVSDYQLPGMNGGQMIRQIRMNTQMRSTPILMLTEDGGLGHTREGLESGADAYLSKSAHPDLIILRIRALLRDGSDFPQAEAAGSFRRARIVIVTRPIEAEEDDTVDRPARWARNDDGTSLGELLWRDGHTVTTVSGSSEMIQGGWFSGDEGPDLLILDLTAPHDDSDSFCRSIDARRHDVVEAGAAAFRIIGVVEAEQFRRHSSAFLFDAGVDDLVPDDTAPEVLALRIKVMVQRKLAQDALREEEIRRQVREVAFKTARSEARAVAAKAAIAEALAQANAELAEANARLLETQSQLVQTAKMASLGELVAGIAHEINNPLAFIIAHEETIARVLNELANPPEALTEKARSDLIGKCINRTGAMRMGLQRIQNLVLSLRRFSRLDESAFRQIDVFEAIDGSLALLSHKFGGDIIVERHLAAPRTLICQSALVNQAVMNMVSNAADAIRAEGASVNPAEGAALGRIVIETSLQQSEDGAFYVISVADDGPGVPAAIKGRVFEPFFTTKPVGEGTGLGLAIAYGVIDAHGGHIEVSEARLKGGRGDGARFTMTIPVKWTPSGLETIGKIE